MGTVITVMNMKGGVGKTTITMNLGGMLGHYDYGGKDRRVLLVDYDPQFNLSQAFLGAPRYFSLDKQRKTTIAILQDDDSILDPYKLQVPGNHEPPSVAELAVSCFESKDRKRCVHLVPSTMDLMYIALGQSKTTLDPMEERFRKFITEARRLYDVILIDCHPAGSIFTKTSLQNSDHVIIPVVADKFASRGVALMMRFIENAQSPGANAPEPHLLFNRTHRSKVAFETENEIRAEPRFKSHCINRVLPYYKVFSDPVAGEGFVWYSGKPHSTNAFLKLKQVTEEFAQRTKV